jgi:hypothetical protein
MLSTLHPFLFVAVILTTIPAWGSDTLPQLPSSGSATLPSVRMAALPDQTLTITCYLGNPNDNQSLGSITVNSPAAAGPTCNSLNYACQGRCFGCYADFDMAEDVCVDSAGRKYMR